MIEFTGKLTGEAKKFFYKVNIRLFQLSACSGLLLGMIIMFIYTFVAFHKCYYKIILTFGLFYSIFFVAISYLVRLSKKILPQKIIIENELVFSQNKITIKTQFTKDIRKVRDYGEFYYLVLPFSKYYAGFICQKSLLANGTLEDFEKIFDGKIERIRK